MAKSYHHFTQDDRSQIYAYLKSGKSRSWISKELGFHKSSIGREITKNSGQKGYRFKQAHNMVVDRKKKASTTMKKWTLQVRSWVENKIKCDYWNPEQISGRMKREFGFSVSHERIYEHVRQDKKNGGSLYKYLRHKGKKYNRSINNGKSGRGCIINRVDIDERPRIVEEKARFGDLEFDTILGEQHKGAILSIVDRCTKYTWIFKLADRTASSVNQAIENMPAGLEAFLKTGTFDNRKEFSLHEKIAQLLNITTYFAKPYHSWERGLNEYTNGLVRQFFSKGTLFSRISHKAVEKVQKLLNTRPRISLDYKTPQEALPKPVASFLNC